jgi:hypothetical protein
MSSYASYKKFGTENLIDNSIIAESIALGANAVYGQQWIFNERGLCCQACANNGGCVEQANGRCCLWTVPDGVTKVTFEIWSGGGGGAGHTCCNCCSFSIGGAGGNYATKTVCAEGGWQYTVCAGGSWPCSKSHICDAGMGCRSFVNGCNLSNFCVTGGCGGWMCNGSGFGPSIHNSGCANCNICGFFGADFGMMGSVGFKVGHGACHCLNKGGFTGAAPFIGLHQGVSASDGWCSCGCYVNWPAGGGMSGQSTYCGSFAKQCAGGSGQGGSGIVRISFM